MESVMESHFFARNAVLSLGGIFYVLSKKSRCIERSVTAKNSTYRRKVQTKVPRMPPESSQCGEKIA